MDMVCASLGIAWRDRRSSPQDDACHGCEGVSTEVAATMGPAMTTDEAAALFGGSKSDLARALGISRQAVSKWGENVPYLRELHIIEVARKRGKDRVRGAEE